MAQPDPSGKGPRISWPTSTRLAEYLIILEELADNGRDVVSSRELAEFYGNNANQVRQDLFRLENTGRVGQGYVVRELEDTIRHTLGINQQHGVAIVGCGRLGSTLAQHVPLANYGLNFVAAFDIDSRLVGTNLGPVRIDHADRITEICRQRNVELAALSVPKEPAQELAEKLVEGGVMGILNYTRVRLRVPETVVVQNRQVICSFIMLSYAHVRRTYPEPEAEPE